MNNTYDDYEYNLDIPDKNDLFDKFEDVEEKEEDISDSIEYEESLIDDIVINVKKKKKSTPRLKPTEKPYYLDPEVFHNTLKEYIVTKAVNSEHVISNKLGRMFVKIVEGVFSRNNFRNYFNGWHDDMKSRAYEHMVKYAHKFKIHYSETTDFFVKWLFREHEDYLSEWFDSQDLGKTYVEFRESLKDVIVRDFKKGKRKRAKEQILDEDVVDIPKTKKSIDIISLKQLYWDLGREFVDADFYTYFFEKYKDFNMQEKYEAYKKRNAFNYFTQIASMAGKHVLSEENNKNDCTIRLEDNIYYRPEDIDSDKSDYEGRFVLMNENSIDWGVGVW